MGQQVRLVGLIALVIVAAVVGYRALFGERPAYDLMVVSAEEAALESKSYGAATDLQPGQVIDVDDVVRTAANGRAALQYGDGAQLMLAESTSLRVVAVDASGVAIDVDEGEVTARVRQGAPPLNVTSQSRTIRATNADFTVMVSGLGDVSAYATRGQLGLQGFGPKDKLSPGLAAHTNENGELIVEAVNEGLLLDVSWPEEERTRLSEVEVTGRTGPFATVTVVGEDSQVRVRSDGEGRFSVKVKLREGVNEVRLMVRDIAGREVERVQRVRRDSTAPVIQAAEVVWGP